MAIVTCRTTGCGNADIGIDLPLTYADDDGNPAVVDVVICGVCGEPITDVTGDDVVDPLPAG